MRGIRLERTSGDDPAQPPAQAETPRAECQGLFSKGLRTFPKRKTAQLL